MEGYFTIGVVVGAHGIRGELKIFPQTDDINRFKKMTDLLVEKDGKLLTYKIERVFYHKKFVMIKLEGIEDANTAESLKGLSLKINRSDAIPLSEDEYYISDLYGLSVFTEEGEELGKLTDIIHTGANDVYEVDKKFYIPAIKDCILKVDFDEKKMVIRMLEGLREL